MQDQDTPAVIYAAKSTEDKRGSIPTQLEDCRKLAEREGWNIIGEYQDEAASAWSGDRGPGLDAAMEHAEREAPSILVVQHSDRLARGDARQARHLVEVVTWAVKAGVTIRSVQDDLFADPRSQLLMGALMGMRNTEDSSRKSAATRAGIKREQLRGIYIGPRPYGYEKRKGDKDKVVLRQNRREAAIVKRIFQEFVNGRSMVAIARGLHRDQIPTATKNATWRQSTVSGILRRPLYVGLVRAGDELVPGEHKDRAIIDTETWQRTCDLLATRPRRNVGRPPRGRHLFRNGMLRCGECGDAMVPRTKTKPSWQEYYCCAGHIQLGNDYCSQGCIQRVDVDQHVYEYFERVALDVEATRQQIAESLERRLAEVRATLEDAEQQADQARETFERIRADYKRGDLPAKDWREEWLPELTEERDAAEAAVKRLREQSREVADSGELRDVEADTLRKLADIRRAIAGELSDANGIEAVRSALWRLFERFVVHVDREAGKGRIEAIVKPERWTVDEELRPILCQREALDPASTNQHEGSGSL